MKFFMNIIFELTMIDRFSCESREGIRSEYCLMMDII